MILSGAEDREVRLHDLMSFETIQIWPCCSGRVKRLAVSPHSPFLCWSASEDGCIRYDVTMMSAHVLAPPTGSMIPENLILVDQKEDVVMY